ncbi:hypothetical protein BH10CYA1_BH10CYA1_55890 [soil metagenome]
MRIPPSNCPRFFVQHFQELLDGSVVLEVRIVLPEFTGRTNVTVHRTDGFPQALIDETLCPQWLHHQVRQFALLTCFTTQNEFANRRVARFAAQVLASDCAGLFKVAFARIAKV